MAYSTTGFGNPFGFRVTPMVKRILLVTSVVTVIVWAFSGLRPFLQFSPATALYMPWTLVTYMLVHAGLFHLLFNMLGLFFFGPPLEERWGEREFLKFYVLTGIAGAVLSFLFPSAPIIGASAAVYGVLVAYAMYWPDNPIYIWGIFPVKAKWLVTFFVGMAVFSAVAGSNQGVAHLAHLGGAAAAFLYLRSPWAPPAWGTVLSSHSGSRRPSAPKKWKAFLPGSSEDKPERTAAAAKPKPKPKPMSRRTEARVLDEVDRILDKISENGIGSLTDEERRQLDEASRRFRSN